MELKILMDEKLVEEEVMEEEPLEEPFGKAFICKSKNKTPIL